MIVLRHRYTVLRSGAHRESLFKHQVILMILPVLLVKLSDSIILILLLWHKLSMLIQILPVKHASIHRRPRKRNIMKAIFIIDYFIHLALYAWVHDSVASLICSVVIIVDLGVGHVDLLSLLWLHWLLIRNHIWLYLGNEIRMVLFVVNCHVSKWLLVLHHLVAHR